MLQTSEPINSDPEFPISQKVNYLEITPFRRGNRLSEVRLNVHSETHRFALGSQILIDCLLLDVIHKYRYSNYLDYNAYHTWLHSPFSWASSSHPRGNKTIKIHHGILIRVVSTFLKSIFSILFTVRTEESPGATQYPFCFTSMREKMPTHASRTRTE